MRDPHEVLGVPPGSPAEAVRLAARRLLRELHPDRFPGASADELTEATRRAAEVTEAVHVLTDARAMQRYRAREARERRGSATANQPGRDGVRFTARSPSAGGAVEPAPGDPDFDYRTRARSEFEIDREVPRQRTPWAARPKRPFRRRSRRA